MAMLKAGRTEAKRGPRMEPTRVALRAAQRESRRAAMSAWMTVVWLAVSMAER